MRRAYRCLKMLLGSRQ